MTDKARLFEDFGTPKQSTLSDVEQIAEAVVNKLRGAGPNRQTTNA